MHRHPDRGRSRPQRDDDAERHYPSACLALNLFGYALHHAKSALGHDRLGLLEQEIEHRLEVQEAQQRQEGRIKVEAPLWVEVLIITMKEGKGGKR